MKNKYWAYSYLSIKTLLLNKSILFGFVFNLIVALIVTVYLIIFEPDIQFLASFDTFSKNFSNALGVLNVIIIMIVILLFTSVSAIMQSVFDDRDSKVSEIINTSISGKHYLFGKSLTSFALIVITLLSSLVAITIAIFVFSIFNPYHFGIYSDILKPLLSLIDWNTLLFLIACLGICVLLVLTSILFALSISIKASNIIDAFPVALLVLTPYFLVFGLLIFLPANNSELWLTVATSASFIPILSPLFILILVLLEGFSSVVYLAILIALVYLIILFKGVTNIYSYAFYVNDKLTLIHLLKLSVNKKI
ncbi:hypothetical protein SAMN04488134_10359 [Amphibacillus marinus]|uniref:Uncharacterized protein n=1 Tax=Amphibacillus marinus TaxID=872970 RepID=A0A1H8L2M2_9BACI|nr:hypothetical protein [Amphibacillus marinus]SEN99383.1 hypothetical protein SAMN04488134_10359 [Amphibacillus marinus]